MSSFALQTMAVDIQELWSNIYNMYAYNHLNLLDVNDFSKLFADFCIFPEVVSKS